MNQFLNFKISRNRIFYALFIALLIPIGISTRKYPEFYPGFIAEFGGDTLWALTAYWCGAFLFPKSTVKQLIIGALIFSYGIEVSQFYHAPWIDTIRLTKLGKLVLGFGFMWSDLVCYTIGIFMGAAADILYFTRKNKNIILAPEVQK